MKRILLELINSSTTSSATISVLVICLYHKNLNPYFGYLLALHALIMKKYKFKFNTFYELNIHHINVFKIFN